MALITISNRYYQLTILTVWDHETMRRVLLTGQQVGLVLWSLRAAQVTAAAGWGNNKAGWSSGHSLPLSQCHISVILSCHVMSSQNTSIYIQTSLQTIIVDTCIMSDPSPPSHDFRTVHYAGQQRIRGSGLYGCWYCWCWGCCAVL